MAQFPERTSLKVKRWPGCRISANIASHQFRRVTAKKPWDAAGWAGR